MAFAGGVKFFEKNKGLKKDGATIAASTGNNSAQYCIDVNNQTVWRSVGSDDTTVETITLTFASAITIDSVFLIGHNWKQFTVKYNTSSDFSNVTGLDGSLGGGIAETTFADSTAFYTFDSVGSVNTLDISATKTQTADEEKYLNQIIVTEAVGTLTGYPEITPLTVNRNTRIQEMLSGRINAVKSIETFAFTMGLNTYPTARTDDLTLLYSLFDREDPFLVWLCGGNRGTTYFGQTLRGFRLEDAIPMQITNAPSQDYEKNVYVAPINLDFEFQEVTV